MFTQCTKECLKGLVVNMNDRLNTIVCAFDPRISRISAFNIHECIHDNMRLAEEDIRAIQVDGPRRRVYIKFKREDRLKNVLQGTNGLLEFRHDNGEISQVRIEHAGMGTREVSVAGLPPEVKDHSIKEYLSKYGDIMSIRDELWAAVYRYKVYNGIRIVEIKLKRHLPSHLAIAGSDALISYEGLPQTCYRCNETGHQQIDCPHKKRLDPALTERRTTWADTVSNTTSDTQPNMNMQQSTPMLTGSHRIIIEHRAMTRCKIATLSPKAYRVLAAGKTRTATTLG